ncbi:MAG: hypothetical protein ACLQIB_23470 [Isosphaeraceae bacterium]
MSRSKRGEVWLVDLELIRRLGDLSADQLRQVEDVVRFWLGL